MLQYAVDTKLDLCLSAIYEAVTRPPMPLNPYPRLLHILRAYAVRLDLFQVSQHVASQCFQLRIHGLIMKAGHNTANFWRSYMSHLACACCATYAL